MCVSLRKTWALILPLPMRESLLRFVTGRMIRGKESKGGDFIKERHFSCFSLYAKHCTQKEREGPSKRDRVSKKWKKGFLSSKEDIAKDCEHKTKYPNTSVL